MEWLELVFVIIVVINVLTNMESCCHVQTRRSTVKKMLSNNDYFAEVGNTLHKLDSRVSNNLSYDKAFDVYLLGSSKFASYRKRRKEKREIRNKARTEKIIKSRKGENRLQQFVNSESNIFRTDGPSSTVKQMKIPQQKDSQNAFHSTNSNCSFFIKSAIKRKLLMANFNSKTQINFKKYMATCKKLNSCGFLKQFTNRRKCISEINNKYLQKHARLKRNAEIISRTFKPQTFISFDPIAFLNLEKNVTDCKSNFSCHKNTKQVTDQGAVPEKNLMERQNNLALSIVELLKKLSPLLIELNKTLSREAPQTTENYQVSLINMTETESTSSFSTSPFKDNTAKTFIIPNSQNMPMNISTQSIPVSQTSTNIMTDDFSMKFTESSNVANRAKSQVTTPTGVNLFSKLVSYEKSSTHLNMFTEPETDFFQTMKLSAKKRVESVDSTTKASVKNRFYLEGDHKLSLDDSYRYSETYTTSPFIFDHQFDISSMPSSYSTLSHGWNYTDEHVNKSYLIEKFKSLYPVKMWETGGQFSEHFLQIIDSHWLQFPPPPPVNHYILAVLYCVVMVIGMIGNALVILMFIRCRSLQTPANILVMNLAVSDFLLLSKMPVFIYNSLYLGPALGEIGCQIYGFMGGLTGTVSIMTLAAISLDRYYVIVYPLDPIRKTTRCRARLSVLFVWCYGCIFSILPLLGVGIGKYVPEGYLTSCSFDYLDFSFNNRLFIFIFFLAAWFLPFCVIMVCYFAICRVVIVTRNVKNAVSEDSSRHEKNRSELRLAGVVIGIIALWFAAWTPYAVVALLGIAGQKEYLTPLSSMIPALFCKTASCIDPYVYAVTHPRFRLEVTTFVRRVSSKRKMRADMKRTSKAWTTEVEMSEPMHHIKRSSRHSSEDYSDVEEVIVAVGTQNRGSISSDEITIRAEPNNDKEDCSPGSESCAQNFVFPIPETDKQKFQPPTWFVAPKPQHDRHTSFKYKGKT